MKDTQAVSSKRNEISFQRCRFIVTAGPDSGRHSDSNGDEFSIGTAEGNDLQLTDPTVSRHHCTVTATPRGFLLRDLESTNGVAVGDCLVGHGYLKPGVSFALGNTQIRFESLDDRVHDSITDDHRFGRLHGRSAIMRRLFAAVTRVAASDATVLVDGETGTGKTMIAEAIHQASARSRHGFVVVDCGAIPPTLIESLLFGHDRGAFTGATAARAGAFEAARRGTIFLDEVGELPLELQPKLLRALEARTINRVGSVEPIDLDVRVIAASNRDLREMVNRNAFRADLYYRLNIVRVRIPPLRERREDIPVLMSQFWKEFAGDPIAEPPVGLAVGFAAQDWPGNVRELRNAVQRAVVLGDPALWEEPTQAAQLIQGASEPRYSFDPAVAYKDAKEQIVAAWEAWYLSDLMRRSRGNLTHAAELAQTDRGYLRQRLKRHRLSVREE